MKRPRGSDCARAMVNSLIHPSINYTQNILITNYLTIMNNIFIKYQNEYMGLIRTKLINMISLSHTLYGRCAQSCCQYDTSLKSGALCWQGFCGRKASQGAGLMQKKPRPANQMWDVGPAFQPLNCRWNGQEWNGTIHVFHET